MTPRPRGEARAVGKGVGILPATLISFFALVGLPSFAAADVVVTPAPGFEASWDGNDGDQAAAVPDNLALASNGATAFSSGDLGPEIGAGFHLATNVNDGLYGNSNGWIGGDTAVPPFHIGVDLGNLHEVRAVAWSRDNTDTFTDRTLGLYVLQITTDAIPGPSSGWTTVASFDYQASDDSIRGGLFTAHLRHEFVVSTDTGGPLLATGVRLLVPGSGIAGGTAIDEIEVFSNPLPTDLSIVPEAGFDVSWDGNDGDEAAGVPDNLALASNGGTPFSSGDLGSELSLGMHLDANLNDGFYGSDFSWIGGNTLVGLPYVGVDLGSLHAIGSIAWSRDNTGMFIDRTLGLYTLQITTDPDPSTTSNWTTIATLDYLGDADPIRGGGFTSSLRHRYSVSTIAGDSIAATGVRLLVPATGLASGTAIDELEVYAPARPVPVLSQPLLLLVLLSAASVHGNRRRRRGG